MHFIFSLLGQQVLAVVPVLLHTITHTGSTVRLRPLNHSYKLCSGGVVNMWLSECSILNNDIVQVVSGPKFEILID